MPGGLGLLLVMSALLSCLWKHNGKTVDSTVQQGIAIAALLILGCTDRLSSRVLRTFLSPRPDTLVFDILMFLRGALALTLIPLLKKNRRSGVFLAATGAAGLLLYLLLDRTPLGSLARGTDFNVCKLAYATLLPHVDVLAAFLFGGLWCALPWREKKPEFRHPSENKAT